MVELTSKQRAFLKGFVHSEKAVFHIGKNGITESFLKAVADYIKAKEILKIKVFELPEDKNIVEIGEHLASSIKAILVGTIGKNIILFKRNPQNPVVEFPKK